MGAPSVAERVEPNDGPAGCFRTLCVALSLAIVNGGLRLLELCTRTHSEKTEPQRILVLRTAALGDFVLSIPALQRLRKSYPYAHLTLLTAASTDRNTLKTVEAYSNRASPWLSLLPKGVIDEIIEFSVTSVRVLLRDRRGILGGRTFDRCFIVTEGFGLTLLANAKKLVFLRMLGARCRIYGIGVRAIPKLFPAEQRGEKRLEHHILAIMRSVEEDGLVNTIPFETTLPYVDIKADSRTWLGDLISSFQCGTKPLVIIAPGSRLEFKRWPVSSYVAVIRSLLADSHVHIALIGSKPEVDTISLIISELGRDLSGSEYLHNLGGKTTLDQLTVLFSGAAVFLGNDGGTCHLAAATGCRVVSISNGAEYPNSVEPWGNQRFTARHNVPCSPCYSFTCCPLRDNKCVTGISTDLVLSLIGQALAELNTRHSAANSVS